MKYKAEDKVKVHTLEYFENHCDKDISNFGIRTSRYLFTNEMYKYCNKYVTIIFIDSKNECYKIKEDNGKYDWCDWMFEEYKFELCEEYKFDLCEFLGVEEEQEFKVDGLKYKIKNNNLLVLESDGWYESVLLFNWFMDKINKYGVVTKYKPKDGDKVYFPVIVSDNLYNSTIYDKGDAFDRKMLEKGLYFRTQEEAVECAKQMLKVIE